MVAELSRRPVLAFTTRNTRDREVRQLALYCTDDIVTTLDLIRSLRVRRHELQMLCAHWGVDYYGRTLLPAEQEVRDVPAA